MRAEEVPDLPQTALLVDDAVLLGSAWLAHRAESLGIRLLILKGPGAAHLRLRPKKSSTDVDVLVEPGRIDELLTSIGPSGWKPRFSPLSPHLIEPHSTTVYHDGWPIDLDLHIYWPGFLADRSVVFEELWRHRVGWSIAGVAVSLPDRPSSALMLALHSLRRPRKEHREGELESLVQTVTTTFTALEFETLSARAEAFGATGTAQPFLIGLGFAPSPSTDHAAELRRWRLNARAKGYTDAWLLSLKVAPWRAKPSILFRALMPTAAEMRGLHPDIATGRRALAAARARRLAGGLRELPHAIRSIGRDRR